MSTRSYIIWEQTGDAPPLYVYHHWDGYLDGLGQTLVDWLSGQTDDRKQVVMKKITDEKVGWSTLNGKNIDLEPGWNDAPAGVYSDPKKLEAWYASNDYRCPQSYTARGEKPESDDANVLKQGFDGLREDSGWADYMYKINANVSEMEVYECGGGGRLIGKVPLMQTGISIGNFVKEDDEYEDE